MFNIQKMMQQAKAMQDKMQVLQEQLAQEIVEGKSGGGLVKILMTCKGECRKVDVDVAAVNPAEKEVLEDLIMAALNDARTTADARMADETQKMMADLGLPAGAKLPF
jgi:hypothetical protein